MNCMQAWRVLPRVEVMGVLEGVRNRLLDLVLKLEREAPDAGEVASSTLPVSTEQITNIVAATIYAGSPTVTDNSIRVHGTAGNIAGGQGNRARQGDVSITQQGIDLGALAHAVRAAVEQLDGQLPPEQLDGRRPRARRGPGGGRHGAAAGTAADGPHAQGHHRDRRCGWWGRRSRRRRGPGHPPRPWQLGNQHRKRTTK